MSQSKQIRKVKTYRILKVLFYCLGLPLFFVAVFLASVKFMGHSPFVGEHSYTFTLFERYQDLFTSPALYGIWVAAGIWAVVAIFHLIISKLVKNPRARMLSVIAFTMVIMLTTLLVLDCSMEGHIADTNQTMQTQTLDNFLQEYNTLQNSSAANKQERLDAMVDNLLQDGYYAPDLKVSDYKTQLSFYRVISSRQDGKSLTLKMIDQVEMMKKVYNVGMQGIDRTGVAGNISNPAICYDEVIGDDGVLLIEKNGDVVSYGESGSLNHKAVNESNDTVTDNQLIGDGDVSNDHVRVRLKPNREGKLVINGEVYSHYFYKEKEANGQKIYVWYTIDMYPNHTQKGGEFTPLVTDGVYGEGIYNTTGLFSDGWVPSLENVLEVLEDYYAKDALVKLAIDMSGGMYTDDESWHKEIIESAHERRNAYYESEDTDPFLRTLYTQEIKISPKFSLTRAELDGLIAELGALLGSNHLFDYLLGGTSAISSMIGPILEQLAEGMSIRSLVRPKDVSDAEAEEKVSATMGTIAQWVNDLVLKNNPAEEQMTADDDLVIVVKYKTPDCDHLYVGVDLVKPDMEKPITVVDIDFNNELLDEENSDYAFDLDHLSATLNKVINNLIAKFNIDLSSGSTIRKVVDVVLGLFNLDGIIGEYIIFDQDGHINIDIVDILNKVVQGLYWYQSSAIKPLYEFYVDPNGTHFEKIAQKAFADYDRAYYTGAMYGKVVGSVMIGDELGQATSMNAAYKFPASFGLQDLQSVQLLKTELDYVPTYYPMYALRDMIAVCMGFVLLFMLLSFVCAQKEVECAEGKIYIKPDKEKKSKAKDSAASKDSTPTEAENPVEEESVAPPASEDAPTEEKKPEKRKLFKSKKDKGADKADETAGEDTAPLDLTKSDKEVR